MIKQEIRTLWQGYLLHVEGLNPILEKMSERGIPVNLEALKEFGEEVDKLKDEAYARLCAIYPLELLPAKQKEGLKKEPKEIALLYTQHCEGVDLNIFDYSIGKDWASFEDKVWIQLGYLRKEFDADLEIEEEFEEFCSCSKGKGLKELEDNDGSFFPPKAKGCKKCEKSGILKKRRVIETLRGKALRWYRPLPFKPSIQQISTYIKFKGYRAQTRATKKAEVRGKEAVTTDKTALLQLFRQTKDEFFDLVLRYRNFDKMISTYCRGWLPKGDGRVHPQFLFRPASGQLSSIAPNCQNIPSSKAGDLGTRFKNVVEARSGRSLIEFDWKSLHAYMLGFLADDFGYMRLSLLDIHSFLAAHILKQMLEDRGLEKAAEDYAFLVDAKSPKVDLNLINETRDLLEDLDGWLELSDKELAQRLTWISKHHKVYRNKVKPAVHGFGFGLGSFKLAKAYPESFTNVKQAQVPLDMLNKAFPLVAEFREEIKRKAQEQGFLISPFGFIRHFNNVYDIRPVKEDYEPKWGERLLRRGGRLYKECSGLDAEKAIAYLPANCSFGYVRDAMLEVARLGLDEEFCLINQVHDSLLFEPLEPEVDSCIEKVLEVMQAANPCLVSELAPEGLRCFASASVGKRWGEMREL